MRGSRQAILKHMVEHPLEGITSKQAFELFGVTRLAAVIYDLRELGYHIDTLIMEGTTRFGEACRYAKYIYKGKPSIVEGVNNGNESTGN